MEVPISSARLLEVVGVACGGGRKRPVWGCCNPPRKATLATDRDRLCEKIVFTAQLSRIFTFYLRAGNGPLGLSKIFNKGHSELNYVGFGRQSARD